MLGLFKGKNKGNLLHSPCNGKVVPITEVPDSTFADKILGDGFAVIPSEGKVYAPADGEVSMVFDTLHAVTMTSRCTCCSWKRYCWSGCCRSRYLCIPQPSAHSYRITSRTEQRILV